jgi:hypothetical protein
VAGSLAETVARVLVARADARRRLTRSDGQLAVAEIGDFCRLPTIFLGLQNGREGRDSGLVTNLRSGRWTQENAGSFIDAVSRLWHAPLAAVPDVVASIWNRGLPGAGASLPTLILHLRAPDTFAVWYRYAHLGADIGPYPEANKRWSDYQAYNRTVREVCRTYKLCPEEADTFLAYAAAQRELRGLGGPAIAAALLLDREAETAEEDGLFAPENLADARMRTLRAIAVRQGQRRFRSSLLDAYGGRCAVTGCAVAEVLEAAHIIPYKGPETDRVQNGLLLRADIHTLFDLGSIAVDPDTLQLLISPVLKGTEYEALGGSPLRLPADPAAQPSREALGFHRRSSGL